MMRVIVTPAVLPPEALAELKDWLGITTTTDDAELASLLAVALEVCADFTGMLPLACGCEEMLNRDGEGRLVPPPRDWQARRYPADWLVSAPVPGSLPGFHELASRPVSGVTGIEGVALDGTRTALATGTYEVRIDAEGSCRIRIEQPGAFHRFAVQVTAGLVTSWDALPEALHHGVMRLAAHQYRQRDTTGAAPLPPASVTALWLPWRRVRLA